MRTQKRLSREEGGNVMIEFAMLAPVFFMLIMGLVEFVLFQYKSYALNHIVYEATRNLQTGEVQAVTGIVAIVGTVIMVIFWYSDWQHDIRELMGVEQLYAAYGESGVRNLLQNPSSLGRVGRDIDQRLRE